MFQGQARGSVGDVVFSRVKGQQVARMRNRVPANPRTEKQMRQRSQFISAVLFYSRGTKNQFKFAFEGKKQTESDFNAFMRLNAMNGIVVTPEQKNNEMFPMIGKWVLSKGSLGEIEGNLAEVGNKNVAVGQIMFNANPTTIGELSAAIAKQGLYKDGDIVTACAIGGGTLDGGLAYAGKKYWLIQQFILDSNSTVSLASLNIRANSNALYFDNLAIPTGVPAGFGFIISRNSPNGLMVSTSTLKLTAETDAAWNKMRTEAYRKNVAAVWGAASDSILQGSLSENNPTLDNVVPADPAAPRVTSVTADGKNLAKDGLIDVARNGAIVVNGANLAESTITLSTGDLTNVVKTANKITADYSFGGTATATITINDVAWGNIKHTAEGGGDSAGGSEYE